MTMLEDVNRDIQESRETAQAREERQAVEEGRTTSPTSAETATP